jgi:hypothetical protein
MVYDPGVISAETPRFLPRESRLRAALPGSAALHCRAVSRVQQLWHDRRAAGAVAHGVVPD